MGKKIHPKYWKYSTDLFPTYLFQDPFVYYDLHDLHVCEPHWGEHV